MNNKREEHLSKLRAEALEMLQAYKDAGEKLTRQEEAYYRDPPLQSMNTYAIASSILTLDKLRKIKQMAQEAAERDSQKKAPK